jgi:hypothetical protein
VAGTNGTFIGSASPVKNVTWSNTVVAPSGCSITGTPPGTVSAGTTVNLTMGCTAGTGLGFSWAGGFAQGLTQASVSGQVQATTTFSATASNSAGSVTKSVTFTVGSSGGGPPLDCTAQGFAHTVVINETWSATSFPRLFTQNFGGFDGNDALIVHFKTGALTAPGKQGMMTLAEFNSPPSAIHATLSASPCDFGNGLQPPFSGQGPSNTIQMFYCVGGTADQCGGYPVLNANTDYYVNVMNVTPSSCQSAPSCDKFIDFAKPRGL